MWHKTLSPRLFRFRDAVFCLFVCLFVRRNCSTGCFFFVLVLYLTFTSFALSTMTFSVLQLHVVGCPIYISLEIPNHTQCPDGKNHYIFCTPTTCSRLSDLHFGGNPQRNVHMGRITVYFALELNATKHWQSRNNYQCLTSWLYWRHLLGGKLLHIIMYTRGFHQCACVCLPHSTAILSERLFFWGVLSEQLFPCGVLTQVVCRCPTRTVWLNGFTRWQCPAHSPCSRRYSFHL